MQQFGGKPKKSFSDSKRHFTVVMGGKEHGLYVSSTPSSAARKAVTKLCTANKSKKVEFYMREITQGSKKKNYGPYAGHIDKLKEPIELKGRVIRYKPVAKLIGKKDVKKEGMKGGSLSDNGIYLDYNDFLIEESKTPLSDIEFLNLKQNLKPKIIKSYRIVGTKYVFFGGPIIIEDIARKNTWNAPTIPVFKYCYEFVIFYNDSIHRNTFGTTIGVEIMYLSTSKYVKKIHLDGNKSISEQMVISDHVTDFINLKNFIEQERIRRKKPDLNYHIYKKLKSLLKENLQNSQNSTISTNLQYSQYSQNSTKSPISTNPQYSRNSRNSQVSVY